MGNERWTRRQFVNRAGKTAGAAVLGLSLADFLAACGTSNSGTGGTAGSGSIDHSLKAEGQAGHHPGCRRGVRPTPPPEKPQ